MNIGGKFISPYDNIALIYQDGKEYVPIVEGISDGDGTVSRESDHLLIETGQADAATRRTWVTAVVVDLTNVDTLAIEWEGTVASGSPEFAIFIADKRKQGTHSTDFAAKLTKTANFSRSVDTLDVSGLSGYYFVRVHGRDDSSVTNRDVNIKVYCIYKIFKTLPA
jgi:hypothetical protein